MDVSHETRDGVAGEMALICAVLRQALADVQEAGEVGVEARVWVQGPDLDWWLECAGLDVSAVREALRRGAGKRHE